MPNSPTGTITFLFTDIEGSTKLWERCPDAMRVALARHDEMLREAIEKHGGFVFKTVGDAFCAAFHTVPDALNAALESHLALSEQDWGETGPIRIRMGIHTGEAEERDNDYFGQSLNRVARLQGVGHGRQTLISQATYELVYDCLPGGMTLSDMGLHRLKDLLAPEHVYQLLHRSLPAEFPPLKSLDYLPTNLPRQMTSFIGREKEMAEVKRLLQITPLLTLTGTGGTGKTRLALQVGANLLEDYKDGVWLVELAPLSDPSLVAPTVATALHLHEEPGRSLTQTLTEHLKDKTLVLLLDNCEHVLEASAQLADVLLKRCPNIHILASSREGLGIAGEHTYRVSSLALPDPKRRPSAESLLEYEASRLFMERASTVAAGFVVTPINAAAVVSVCHRLDGIPLAIELAAARVRSMPIEEINTRLDNRFRLLTGGSRTSLPRQKTLRSLLDWSYDLLNEQEKMLLHRLSVFAGGWTVEAAEKVCSGDGIEEYEVVDLLLSLSDKSLVVYEEKEGQARYRLLETIRHYAQEKLQAGGELESVQGRHQSFYLNLVEDAKPNLRGPEQGVWLHRLETEHDNLRTALHTEDYDACLRIAGALGWFWYVRGYLSEGRARLDSVLRETGRGADTTARAKALEGAGKLAWSQGDYAAAQVLYEQGLAISRKLGDTQGIGTLLNNLGVVALYQGDYASARMLYEQSLTIMRQLGDKEGVANSLTNLGHIASDQGDYAAARTLIEQSLEIRRELGDQGGVAASLSNLSLVASDQGDYTAARTLCEQSLEIRRGLGDIKGIGTSLNNLGIVALYQGDYASARLLYEESLPIMRQLGDKEGVANSLNDLGIIALYQKDYVSANMLHEESLAIARELGSKQGIARGLYGLATVASYQREYASARMLYEESLTITRQLGDKEGVATSLEALAALDANQEQSERAARLWGAAQRLREEIGSPLPLNEQNKHDSNVADARRSLGAEAFSSAWAEGRAMTMEQAVTYAFNGESSGYPH